MPKRTSKEIDVNLVAASIVGHSTKQPTIQKNPAAVALGRLGGLVGRKSQSREVVC
jgi:hypothetical protein